MSLQAHRAVRRTVRIGLAALLLLAGGASLRTYLHLAQARQLNDTTQAQAVRSVITTRAKPSPVQRDITLPATLRGAAEAAVYARTSGYLQRWTRDIGEPVRKGELLAVIDTPEVDQDLAQALAGREQIKARLALAASSLGRWEGLRERDAVSQQELDERRAAHQQATADLASAEAQIRRLQQLQGFNRITAPFDGVVVRREVDTGALVSAGSGNATRELFYIARTNPLKLTVAVPQAYAAGVRVGQQVDVRLIEQGAQTIKGTVARSAGAIDAATRSMQVEVELPNKEGHLLPGAYAEVSVPLKGSGAGGLSLPPQVLQFRQDGPRIAVVTAAGTIDLRTVKLGRDFGRSIEVLSGITVSDAVVLNPPDAIEQGETVLAREAVDKPAKPAGGKS
ncbi:MAG: efflux RND transporter periplasmic adaptor subunit [Pseudomonadota bacterium]